MDAKKWITNNKWIFLIVIYLISLSFQVYKFGSKAFLTAAGIGLIIAILTTLFSNLNSAKKTVRKIKHFIGYGTFKWEAISVFTIRKDSFSSIYSQEPTFYKISEKSLENNGIKIKNSESIQMSYDKLKRLKIFLEEYVMYLDISVTDADYIDDDGYDLVEVTIKTKASLRFKDNNKAINGLLLDFYYYFDKEYNPIEQKFTVKIQPENMSKNLLKNHFINEFEADEIDSFNIISKKSKSTIEKVNQSTLTLTSDRREELNGAIKSLILRLS